MPNYNPAKIEKKWQKFWQAKKIYKSRGNAKKFYVLDMFPYPSGEGLHVGHPRGYIATDVVARFKMRRGFNVLHPMGWDAFGLPAENYALANKIHPKIAVSKNIKRFKEQMNKIGFTYDWSKEINTTDPEYYKWTQWIFLKMFENGLVYGSREPIIWCPSCKTGLALEDLEDGKCERCGSEVEKKPLRQWVLKMTTYAEKLLNDLKSLDWPQSIIDQQRNWIGKSEGALIRFSIVSRINADLNADSRRKKISVNQSRNQRKSAYVEVFTTRLDTIFGCTYLVVAPEHLLVEELKSNIKNYDVVRKYVNQAKKKTDLARTMLAEAPTIAGGDVGGPTEKRVGHKTGVELKGIKAINPFNNEKVPIFVADYVLGSYGTGAVMAVPAHDQRDWEFAKKYKLPIKEVISPEKLNCIVVHGCPSHDENNPTKRTYDKHWIPWIKKQLIFKKIPIKTPLMPKPWVANYDEWKREFEKNEIMENSILIGHSCGSAFLVRWLGETKKRIHKLILVAPWKIPSNETKRAFYTFDIDPSIRSRVDSIIIFTANNEEEDGKKSAKLYHRELGGKIIELKGHGHYTMGDMGTEEFPELLREILEKNKTFVDDGILINSEKYTGMSSQKAREEMVKWLEKNKSGGKKINYKMRDWVFARQRYWGEPFPLVFCPACKKLVENSKFQIPNSKQLPKTKKFKIQNKVFALGEVLNPGWIQIPEKSLPVKLPEVKRYQPSGTGESPLANIKDWVMTKCPKCNGHAYRETNTMPQWAGSNWYYLAYLMKRGKKYRWDKKEIKKWMPVDLYVGGVEHATRHLLYARFWYKFLYDIDAVPNKEPFQKLMNQGLILAEDGRKMSKRWKNVINPDDIIKNFGADTLRLYEMFMGPFVQSVAWSTDGLKGMKRFLDRVWKMRDRIDDKRQATSDKRITILINQTIKKVTEDIEEFKFNTAVSALMILANDLEKEIAIDKNHYLVLISLLSPFAPHFSEELWSDLASDSDSGRREHKSIHISKWPNYDSKLIHFDEFDLVVQINGKVRDKIFIRKGILQKEAKKAALNSEKIKQIIGSAKIKKIIFVPDRLINIVL